MGNRSFLVIGGRRGDEGKAGVVGKLALAYDCRVIIRFAGGANSGHTLVHKGETYVCNAVPVGGVLGDGFTGVIGPYVVLLPRTHPASDATTKPRIGFPEEVTTLRGRGLPVDLVVDGRCHVTLDWYLDMERALESGEGRVGSTGNGIAWTYAMLHHRFGIRVIDCMDPGRLRGALERQREFTRLLKRVRDPMAEFDQLKVFGEWLRCNVVITDTASYVYEQHHRGQGIIFEGAQAYELDPIRGTYPQTTASFPAIPQTLGWVPSDMIPVVVVKAYDTMVGGGILPGRIRDRVLAEKIRQRGNERGARTGRLREVGWLDLVRLMEAIRCNGMGKRAVLAVTKLDILYGLPSYVCIAYVEVEGGISIPFEDVWKLSQDDLGGVSPRLIEMPRFSKKFLGVRTWRELPSGAQQWLRKLAEYTRTEIGWLSTGPGTNDIIAMETSLLR